MSYYDKNASEVLEELESRKQGLTTQEFRERLQKNGANGFTIDSSIQPLAIFFSQFKNFIIYILLFAVLLSVVIGEWADSVVIMAILIVNAFIGFFQELSAQQSLEALKKLEPIRAAVIRNNERQEIDAKDLVVGDVVSLQPGDKVPADGRIIESTRLQIEESLLTGESLPSEKNNETMSRDVSLGKQHNMVFSSTSVVTGHGKIVVTATGMDTEVGRITDLVASSTQEKTPLQRRLSLFGKKLGLVIIAICILVFTLLVFKAYMAENLSTELFVSFLFIAVSLAVAAVPTALPAVVTIALSVGVKRLLVKKVLVRKLSSVETLGSCDVICTDKTGTLTQNQMTVRHGWTPDGVTDISGVGYEPKGEVSCTLTPLLFQAGWYCNNADLQMKSSGWHHFGDPTEVALLVSAMKARVGSSTMNRLDELPFSSERKLMSVLVEDENGEKRVFSKGAADHLLQCCHYVLKNGERVTLDDRLREEILQKNEQYGAEAMRVLAFAYKEVLDENIVESDLVFIGLQAIVDPPREDVVYAVEQTQKAGIRVVMMTGDSLMTAQSIGAEVGINGGVCSGDELNRMDDRELQEALANGVNIFARVAPEHKQRIVTVLQKLGYTVAMAGDGVNDGPALKKANVGIAVGSGTEVAKEASDFVLLDDSFSHIVNAIREGRGIYDNIQKSIMLLLSGNLGEVLIIFLAVLFGWNLPLTAILLLWINMVTDGAPALAFSLDPYGKDIMHRKPKSRDENILPGPQLTLILILGTIGTVFGLSLFSLYGGGETGEQLIIAQTMVFHFVILYEMVLVFVIRRSYKVPLMSNGWIWAAVSFSIGLQVLLSYTSLNEVFTIRPLTLQQVGVLLVATLLFWMVTQLYQYVAMKKG